MAAQLRYRTLVHNIGRVYASPAEGRTDLLQAGLDEIVATQSPTTAKEWNTVGTDAERLLKVWVAKEGGAAAHEAAAQIVDLLYELAATTEAPALVVSEPAVVLSDRIAHIPSSMPDLEDVSAINTEEKSVHVLVESDEDEEAEEAEAEEETEEEIDGEGEAAEATEEVEEEGAAVTAEAEEEVLEPEAEEEEEAEEEGMEVEQIFIRGRAYWHETNTHKLYAVAGEDDVGDEVGELVEGKPRFYAK